MNNTVSASGGVPGLLALLMLMLMLATGPVWADGREPGVVVQQLGLGEFSQVLSGDTVDRLLDGYAPEEDPQVRRGVAALLVTGVLRREELDLLPMPVAMERAVRAMEHPYFIGWTGDPGLLSKLQAPLRHDDILQERGLLSVLGRALAEGHITGYDLRRKDVYSGFEPGTTFIYSHGSLLHLRQLTALMAAHGLSARVYVAPKVSAFLYREDWGSASDAVQQLPGGIRVVNGREAAVLFEFSTPAQRLQFHELVQRFAKKDQADEPGLIADAWWQPFYYTDQPFAQFPQISLAIVSADDFEATLTLTHDRVDQVAAALRGGGYPVRVDKVWVNPAFHRFLLGDYR